ncbi:hypothetical protein ANCDUO_15114 [Ancylostoma duodenale]|uniref:Uncharacterized protein n=1 Tax=Ancylostoma duodenale TaxID=51022 RepID=A0A0C2CEH8_9BILA|nr:hypothetical protein ANCDUO_15114 [Ancylostoma duodenale]
MSTSRMLHCDRFRRVLAFVRLLRFLTLRRLLLLAADHPFHSRGYHFMGVAVDGKRDIFSGHDFNYTNHNVFAVFVQ